MRVTRVTLSLPTSLWEHVRKTIPARQRSGLVARAIEAELLRRKRIESLDDLRKFQKTMKEKYGELPPSGETLEELRLERAGDGW